MHKLLIQNNKKIYKFTCFHLLYLIFMKTKGHKKGLSLTEMVIVHRFCLSVRQYKLSLRKA